MSLLDSTRQTLLSYSLEVLLVSGLRSRMTRETPLSVQWVWPSQLSYSERYEAMVADFERALELDPQHPTALSNLAS